MAGIADKFEGIGKPIVINHGANLLVVIGDVYRREDMQRQVIVYLVDFKRQFDGWWTWVLKERRSSDQIWETIGESRNSYPTILDAHEEVLSVVGGR